MFRKPKPPELGPTDAAARAEQGAVLLDVREADEWAAGHAPQARHVPLGHVDGESGSFTGDVVLTICRSGRRSAAAAKTLAKTGVEVFNVSGGMQAWQRAGLPVVRDDGTPGTVA